MKKSVVRQLKQYIQQEGAGKIYNMKATLRRAKKNYIELPNKKQILKTL